MTKKNVSSLKQAPAAWARVVLVSGRSDVGLWDIASDAGHTKLSVGSDGECDWKIEEQGVKPLHFHFVWDGSGLWVQRTEAPLRANTQPIAGARHRLRGHVRLEFGRAAMVIMTSDASEKTVPDDQVTAIHDANTAPDTVIAPSPMAPARPRVGIAADPQAAIALFEGVPISDTVQMPASAELAEPTEKRPLSSRPPAGRPVSIRPPSLEPGSALFEVPPEANAKVDPTVQMASPPAQANARKRTWALVAALALTAAGVALWSFDTSEPTQKARPATPANTKHGTRVGKSTALDTTPKSRAPRTATPALAASSVPTAIHSPDAHAEQAAANLLIAGRYAEALPLYRNLSQRARGGSGFAVVARILERKVESRCTNGVDSRGEPCAAM